MRSLGARPLDDGRVEFRVWAPRADTVSLRLRGSDVQLQPVGDGCYEGVTKYDLQDVATHEFGHTYGLDHVSAAFDTMAPTATLGETYKRSLASGDAAGLRSIF